MTDSRVTRAAALIRNVPDFPKPGIQFKDISTLLLVPDAFRETVRRFRTRYADRDVQGIVGVDAARVHLELFQHSPPERVLRSR